MPFVLCRMRPSHCHPPFRHPGRTKRSIKKSCHGSLYQYCFPSGCLAALIQPHAYSVEHARCAWPPGLSTENSVCSFRFSIDIYTAVYGDCLLFSSCDDPPLAIKCKLHVLRIPIFHSVALWRGRFVSQLAIRLRSDPVLHFCSKFIQMTYIQRKYCLTRRTLINMELVSIFGCCDPRTAVAKRYRE